MTFDFITTNRYDLLKLTPEVYQYVFTTYNQEELKAFFGVTSKAEFLKEKSKFEKGMTTYNRSFVNFLIIDKSTKETIGSCGFHTWYLEHSRAEIGYALNSDVYKGKGVMSEVLKAVVHYGFTQMQLHRIEAFISPENIASLKLVQKLNFIKEGHLREHYFKNNVMEDSLVFSLLKHEYKP
ncbi:GNAT family N-acetyltransferase [Flavobacterium sp. SM15]|uniref:GNAT family N-acetyltransferase n=1 Tax=Flavobacterium sp. SM15 TaxID=2908005 RepID=UPI001EDC013E|nr:GNAT family protein [Flavobacterium sp. SM15]MCG2612428.1 GNAT family N-acetyltransferase [Flavobacterium sp. SM15]